MRGEGKKKRVKKEWEKEGRPRPYLYLAFPPTPPTIEELTRKGMEGGFNEGRMGGVGGKARYKYGLGREKIS
jgi:hypothetical protein